MGVRTPNPGSGSYKPSDFEPLTLRVLVFSSVKLQNCLFLRTFIGISCDDLNKSTLDIIKHKYDVALYYFNY